MLLTSLHTAGVLKVIDFGLSNTIEGEAMLETQCGSMCYSAPEMLVASTFSVIFLKPFWFSYLHVSLFLFLFLFLSFSFSFSFSLFLFYSISDFGFLFKLTFFLSLES